LPHKKRSPNKFDFLFPPTLVGKLLEKKEVSALNREWLEYIERYLETRDPDYLIKAICCVANIIFN